MHTTASDGRHDIETMAIAARDAGRSLHLHHRPLAVAGDGQRPRRRPGAGARRPHPRGRTRASTASRSSPASRWTSSPTAASTSRSRRSRRSTSSSPRCTRPSTRRAEAMTVRVLTAMACPFVDAIGHPTGRKILRREPHRIDVEALIEAAGLYGIALEINSNYHRLDLSDVHARRAKAAGRRPPDRQRRALDHRARPAALGRADGAAGVAGAGRRLEHARRRRLPQRPAPASPAGRRRRRDGHDDRRRDAGAPEGALLSRRRRRRSRTPSTRPSICSRRCRAEDDRERAAVYMEGLAEMRQEWRSGQRRRAAAQEAKPTRR